MSDTIADDDVLGNLPDELREHVRTEISAFEIERVANKGANGYLVFGENNISGKKIAIKYYYWMGDDEYHAEPRKLASIEHENIVKLDHAGYVNSEWAFFIMPQLRSGDLDDYISQGQIDLKKSIKLVFEVASALSELHSKGILHCDLKPENILLSDEGNVVIADFGSVKQLREGTDGVPGSGHSIAYRPPESFNGQYTKRGDVYQCGIVLYQLVGGTLPYDETAWLTKSQREQYGALSRADQSKFIDAIIEKRAKTGKLIDFNSLPAWLPNSILTIIRRATAVDPARRYSSASDLCADLHEYGTRTVNWIADNESIRVDFNGRSYRIIEGKSSLYICEKKLHAMWRRHNAILPGSRDSVVMALRHELGI